jgi:hypothetical protein
MKLRMMKGTEYVARMVKNVNNILGRKAESKRPLARSKSRWEDTITMNVKENA